MPEPMPMPLYGPMFSGFEPHHLDVGERLVAGTADPWEKEFGDAQVETVTGRPWGRIVTDRSVYLRNGREARTWWQWYKYPRRILAREGELR